MNAKQLREYIVRPALKSINQWSENAEALVMGTASQESHLKYIKQLGNGPALSFFQMEPATHDDIWDNYLNYRPALAELVCNVIEFGDEGIPTANRLLWDMRYAAIMCRIHYRRVAQMLPDAHDVWGLAAYWKKHYNTEQGAGTEQEFVDNFRLVQ